MAREIRKEWRGYTGLGKSIGTAVDAGIKKEFIGKVSLPAQQVIGSIVSVLNRKGFVDNNVLADFKMDALAAEDLHSSKLEDLIEIISNYLIGYGRLETYRTSKRGVYTTHWRLVLNRGIFRIMEHETKKFSAASLKRMRTLAVQTFMTDILGVNTAIEGLDEAYLEGLHNQQVFYKANIEFVQDNILDVYSESRKMKKGGVQYRVRKNTKMMASAHVEYIKAMDGNSFPVNERQEPRGRAAAMQNAMFGMNFYGKTEETQCFHLGEETVAWDARQSGYQLGGSMLGAKLLSRITGAYGKNKGGDIYMSAFASCVSNVFGVTLESKADRDVVKKAAQMLAYMSGMASILTNDDTGLGSILSHVHPDEYTVEQFEEWCELLEQEFWDNEILYPIMALRQATRDGMESNYAVPSWRLPGTSRYFFSRMDTNFLYWEGGKLRKTSPIFTVFNDDGSAAEMTMHISMFRELAKASAILAAIFHSVDGWLKKKVSLDVWAAGGKILVKHDEYVVSKPHVDIMIASYHKWLAYIGDNRHAFLQAPLEECGYLIDLDSLVRENERRTGKFDTKMVAKATNGLAFEWEISVND